MKKEISITKHLQAQYIDFDVTITFPSFYNKCKKEITVLIINIF